jgi:hypothetical protein
MPGLRQLRGVLGITATWSVAFAGVGVVLALLLALALAANAVPPSRVAHEHLFTGVVARWAIIGALSGVTFAGAVMVAERRQTLASLSAHRFARWGLAGGAIGAAAVAAAFIALVLPAGALAASGWSLAVGFAAVPLVGGLLGRATAAVTLRAARRDVHGPALTSNLAPDLAPAHTPRLADPTP